MNELWDQLGYKLLKFGPNGNDLIYLCSKGNPYNPIWSVIPDRIKLIKTLSYQRYYTETPYGYNEIIMYTPFGAVIV